MKRFIFQALSTLAALLLIVAVLFTAVQLAANDEAWVSREYEKLNLESRIGIPQADIVRAFMRMVDYMEGRVPTMQLTVTENGKAVDMYNARETDHMLDVRALYGAWKSVRGYGLLLAAALLTLALLIDKKDAAFHLSRAFLRASALFFILLGLIAGFAALDFTAFWDAFHYLFFTNDLWLLDPATDRMIRICPEQLFSDLVLRIGGIFLLAFGVLFAASAAVYRTQRNRVYHGK